jgi:hypothetical protein
VEALRVVRGWGTHNFQTFSSQMVARLSALRAGRFLPPGEFLVLIFVRGWVDSRAMVRLEGLGKFKKSTSFGTRTGDLTDCSIVPQPTMLPRAPASFMKGNTKGEGSYFVSGSSRAQILDQRLK